MVRLCVRVCGCVAVVVMEARRVLSHAPAIWRCTRCAHGDLIHQHSLVVRGFFFASILPAGCCVGSALNVVCGLVNTKPGLPLDLKRQHQHTSRTPAAVVNQQTAIRTGHQRASLLVNQHPHPSTLPHHHSSRPAPLPHPLGKAPEQEA